jgi:hypothetical protein
MQLVWETAEVNAGFWRKNVRERDYFEYQGIDGRIKMDFQETGYKGIDWIDLVQDRHK